MRVFCMRVLFRVSTIHHPPTLDTCSRNIYERARARARARERETNTQRERERQTERQRETE